MEEQQSNTPEMNDERIVLNDHCINYVQEQIPGLSHDQMRQAIEEAGPILKDIINYARVKFKVG